MVIIELIRTVKFFVWKCFSRWKEILDIKVNADEIKFSYTLLLNFPVAKAAILHKIYNIQSQFRKFNKEIKRLKIFPN